MLILPPPNHRGPRLLLAGLLSVGVHVAALGIAGAWPVAPKPPTVAVDLSPESPWSPGLEDTRPDVAPPDEPSAPDPSSQTVPTAVDDSLPPPAADVDFILLPPIPPRNVPIRPNAARPPSALPARPNPAVASGLPPGDGSGGGTSSGPNAAAPGGGRWLTPKPVYPNALKMARQTGSGSVRIQTDATGRVVRAEMVQPITPALDAVTTNFARAHWSGPPNRTVVVPVTFELR